MEQARDKNGKTESEFLRDYDVTNYFRPSVTVDAVLFCRKTPSCASVLLIKRGGHPYIGDWAFPGGFVEKDEPCEVAVARELYEETGIQKVSLSQLVTASTPDRDPRWRNITVVYAAELDREQKAVGGDDAACAEWFDISYHISKTADGEIAMLKLAGSESFETVLRIERDNFGQIDLNNTLIIERGKLAFDHAKILCYLFEKYGVKK